MPSPNHPQDDVESLVRLARSFADRQRFVEAAELFQLALTIDPKNSGLRLALAEVRRMEEQFGGTRPKSLKETMREQQRRDAIDAAHFLGLADFYAGRGENAKALSCLEMSKAKDPVGPAQHKLHGKLLARHKEYEGAARELAQALRFDPFDRELAELLGRVEYERRRFRESLDATVQAFLLLHDGDEQGAERLRRRIRTLRQILGYDNEELLHRFHAGRERLEIAFERLQWHRERFLQEGSLAGHEVASPRPERQSGGLIELAARIRHLGAVPGFSDPQIIQVAQVAREEFHERGRQIFDYGSTNDDLYLVESGRVSFQRETSYGVFQVREIGPGQILGETNFITRLQRTGEAVALEPTRLFRFDAGELRRLIRDDAEFGVQLYWTFWHSLARKLRATNGRLQSFFAQEDLGSKTSKVRTEYPEAALKIEIDSNDKIRLLQEQGLSKGELMTLATFSREKRFPAGASIFTEGDEGKEMYVILEGKARICKYIQGVGEEALAILERGDFFGEMSLIDGEPRSADARAHDGPVTVLALDQATFREILAMDAHASLELLQLLCRLIARRLSEMNAKLIGWSILAGPHNAAASTTPVPQVREAKAGA